MSIPFVLVNEQGVYIQPLGMFTLYKVPWYSLEVTQILRLMLLSDRETQWLFLFRSFADVMPKLTPPTSRFSVTMSPVPLHYELEKPHTHF